MSYIGNKEIVKVFAGTKEVTDIFAGNNKVYSSGPNADPILENNDWATIRSVCEAGLAADYWAIGDTKTDVGTDGNTRTFQIVDMQGLYGKHVVFMQVELEPNTYMWNANYSNNNYSISDMRVTHLPAILLKYSSELQTNLTNTTYKVAQNGNSATILDLTDKLFLPAEKEMYGVTTYSRSEEAAVLSQYQYYIDTAASYKRKTKIGESSTFAWWERSPRVNFMNDTCNVGGNSGSASSNSPDNSFGVAPIFSF